MALAEKLKEDYGCNSVSLLAAPIAVVESGSVVDSHWVLLGALNDINSDKAIWSKSWHRPPLTIHIEDLFIFTLNQVPNLSNWLNDEKLYIEFSHTIWEQGEDPITIILSQEPAKGMGISNFCLRALITPKDHIGAGVWIRCSPMSPEELKARLNDDSNSCITPHIQLPIKEAFPLPGRPKNGRPAFAQFSR